MTERPTAVGISRKKPTALELPDFPIFKLFWPKGYHLSFGFSWRRKEELGAMVFLETRSGQGEVPASLTFDYTIIYITRRSLGSVIWPSQAFTGESSFGHWRASRWSFNHGFGGSLFAFFNVFDAYYCL